MQIFKDVLGWTTFFITVWAYWRARRWWKAGEFSTPSGRVINIRKTYIHPKYRAF